MPTDPLLRDALRAIKIKIESTASTSTAEELAYLGTAIDRIGGRATVLEVEAIGDVKKAELSAHATTVASTMIATINAAAQTAIGQTTAAANSVTQQLALGRKTFFLAQL